MSTIRSLCLFAFCTALCGQNPNAAVFPGAVATDNDLLVASNNAVTTLAAGVDAVTGTIVLTSAARFVTPLAMTIDGEILRCLTHTGVTYTCTRGFNGTAAATHPFLAVVSGNSIAWPLNQLAAEVKAIETSATVSVFGRGSNGAQCDDVTDDTAALNNLLATLAAGSGGTVFVKGTCLINSAEITIPTTNGTLQPKQPGIRITGLGTSASGTALDLSASPSVLDLRYNAPAGKIDTRGLGKLEIDHLLLTDGGTDCATFVFTTNTSIHVHDVTFQGTHLYTAACNDAVQLGGDGSTGSGNLATSWFQGYGSIIDSNFFLRVAHQVWCHAACNAIQIVNNSGLVNTGSSQTGPITAATNASPVSLTLTDSLITLPLGTKIPLVVSGGTGAWAAINGTWSGATNGCSVTGTKTCTIPINSTAFGAIAGTVVYLNGSAIELGAPAGQTNATGTTGNVVTGNYIEASNYPFPIKLENGANGNFVTGNTFWDTNSTSVPTIAHIYMDATSSYNLIQPGYLSPTASLNQIVDGTATLQGGCGNNTVLMYGQTIRTCFAQPVTFVTPATFNNPPLLLDTVGASWQLQPVSSSGNKHFYFLSPAGNPTMSLWDVDATQAQLSLGGTSIAQINAVSQLQLFAPATVFVGQNAGTGIQVTGGVTRFSNPPKFAGTNTTGAGTPALGTNSPATVLTAPYTWVQIVTADGTLAYIPAWK